MTAATATSGLGEIFADRGEPPSGPVLTLDEVTVRFGGVSALSGVTAELDAYDVAAVIGPNGAGKTTLLNTICGLNQATSSGEISLLGRSLRSTTPAAIARAGVSRSFQDPPLVEHESVIENVLAGAHLLLHYRAWDELWRRRRVGRYEADARRRASAVLEFAGIGHLAREQVSELPYGTRKLIDVSRALVSGPTLLLLDEPTSGLDSEEQKVVGGLLREIRALRRVTVLVVEHHMDFVRTVATRVIGLQAGRVLAMGTPSQVLDSGDFQAALVGRRGAETPEAPGAPGAPSS